MACMWFRTGERAAALARVASHLLRALTWPGRRRRGLCQHLVGHSQPSAAGCAIQEEDARVPYVLTIAAVAIAIGALLYVCLTGDPIGQ